VKHHERQKWIGYAAEVSSTSCEVYKLPKRAGRQVILEWLVLCASHLKITLMIALLLPAIMIVFSAELLQGEYCINAIDSTNNHKFSTILIPLFHCSFIPYSVFSGVPV